MFDGKEYSVEFRNTIAELEMSNGKRQIEIRLRLLELNLYEGFLGVFAIVSCVFVLIIFTPLTYILEVNNYSIIIQLLYLILIMFIGIVFYFIQKLIFWYEIGRHVAPRKFGEFTHHDDPTLPPDENLDD